MIEFIICMAIGAFCVIMGILNCKGNISTVHSYHRKRVSDEDRLPFGKLVGLGTILNGVGLILFGVFSLLAQVLGMGSFNWVGGIFLIVFFVLGLVISFYAMIKYNKGIF